MRLSLGSLRCREGSSNAPILIVTRARVKGKRVTLSTKLSCQAIGGDGDWLRERTLFGGGEVQDEREYQSRISCFQGNLQHDATACGLILIDKTGLLPQPLGGLVFFARRTDRSPCTDTVGLMTQGLVNTTYPSCKVTKRLALLWRNQSAQRTWLV